MINLHSLRFVVFSGSEKLENSFSKWLVVIIFSMWFVSCTEKNHEPDAISANVSEVSLEDVNAIVSQLLVPNTTTSSKHLRSKDYTVEKYYSDSINNFL